MIIKIAMQHTDKLYQLYTVCLVALYSLGVLSFAFLFILSIFYFESHLRKHSVSLFILDGQLFVAAKI